MTSLVFGVVLIFYAYQHVSTRQSVHFYVDRVLLASAWGTLFLFNGLFGYVYLQNPAIDILIFFYIVSFFIGHTVSGAALPFGAPSTAKLMVPNIYLFVLVCSVVGMLAPYEMMTHGARGVEGFVDGGSYSESIQRINSEFRTGQIEQSLLGKIGFAAPQAGLILLGIVMTVGRFSLFKKAMWAGIACFPLVLFTVVSTIRSPLFLSIMLLGSGVVSGMTIIGTERSIFKKQYVVAVAVMGVTLFLIMLFFQSIRLKDYNFNRVGDTIEHMRIWFAGYIPAFGNWVQSYWNGELTFGASSFRFLAGLISGRSSYLDTIQTNIFLGNWTYGNASTMLRVVVNDFGVLGCAGFMFFWGAISRVLLSITRTGNLIGASLFACNLAAIIWSPNQWLFLYGSRVLAPATIIAFIILKAIERRMWNAPHLMIRKTTSDLRFPRAAR